MKSARFRHSATRSRSGFTLVELMISGLLLAAIVASAVPTIACIARERREAERRQQALLAAENLLERLSVVPWSRLDESCVADLALSERTRSQLADPELRVQIVDEPGAVPARRISVEIGWPGQTVRPLTPVRLTAWAYPRTGEAP